MLDRFSKKDRITKETSIKLEINLDGTGNNEINTGVGFLISHEDNICELLNYKVPYTISSFSQNLVSIVLRYPEKVLNNAKQIIEQREKLYENLIDIQKNAAMNIEFYPSNGNYIYGKTAHKEALIKGLENIGIIIRNFNDDTFRITVGSPMQNRKVVDGIKKIFVYK